METIQKIYLVLGYTDTGSGPDTLKFPDDFDVFGCYSDPTRALQQCDMMNSESDPPMDDPEDGMYAGVYNVMSYTIKELDVVQSVPVKK
jgi:hypothetical protein